uniref:EGF-like domain-containing protein n=1 Tax=Gopherus evgoodei TaxID=1825980 RepID=A0A8C4WPD0_9SAUR
QPGRKSVDHDSCVQSPCQNGGSCLRRLAVKPVLKSHESIPVIIMANEPLQPFVCRCMPGYDGNLCEIDIDECLPSPCHNDGTCHNLVGGFSCNCPDGFTGMACERDINECLSSPCKNGAVCQNFPGSFNCVCKTGYTGMIFLSFWNYSTSNEKVEISLKQHAAIPSGKWEFALCTATWEKRSTCVQSARAECCGRIKFTPPCAERKESLGMGHFWPF